jgi:DnaJ-domain-containing protein 1
MEAVLRIRASSSARRRCRFAQVVTGGRAPAGMQLAAAYQILEVDPKASDEDVAKAYRRQLSKHHPDKLKANGCRIPCSSTPNNARSRSSRRTNSSSRRGRVDS